MMLHLTVNIHKKTPNVSSVKVYSKFFAAASTRLLDPSQIFDVLQGKKRDAPITAWQNWAQDESKQVKNGWWFGGIREDQKSSTI